MRKSASWMVIWDDRILELATHEDAITVKKAKESGYVHITQSQITRRLNKLADHGLLRRLEYGVFTITELGEEYLNGEINANDIPDVTEDEGESAES